MDQQILNVTVAQQWSTDQGIRWTSYCQNMLVNRFFTSWNIFSLYQVGGLFAVLASFYFLSQGWAMATRSPLYILWNWATINHKDISCFEKEGWIIISYSHVPSVCYTSVIGELNWKLPFSDSQDVEVQSEEVLGVKEMLIPVFAGILSALRRVIARRVSLKVLIVFCYIFCMYLITNFF